MEASNLNDYRKLISMVTFPLEVLKTDFENAKADHRCNINDVLDETKWLSDKLFRVACIAVLLSRQNSYCVRESIRYSQGFMGQNAVIIVEKNYN
jgi:hypothetical protein